MRSPLRWKLRTLLIAILAIGVGLGVIEMRRRSHRYRDLAREYHSWDGKLSQVLGVLEKPIERSRYFVDMAKRGMKHTPSSYESRLSTYEAELDRRLTVRSKFLDLREYARHQELAFSHAARRPWESVPEGKNVGPMADALRGEFFAPHAQP